MTTTHTIPTNTTAKLIGLAATGAAMLGMNLSDALLLDPQELSALIRSMHGAGHTTTTTAATPAAEPAPAATAQPELALGYEPTPAPAGSLGILARAARLNQPQA